MSDLVFNPSHRKPSSNRLFMHLDIPSPPLDAHHWIVAGVSPDILIRLVELVNSDIKTICHLVGISPRTLNRKLKHGAPLTLAQGTRVYGAIQALDAAVSLHGEDLVAAMSWLHCSAKGLGSEKPASLLVTAVGVQAVIELIGRIEHGIVS